VGLIEATPDAMRGGRRDGWGEEKMVSLGS